MIQRWRGLAALASVPVVSVALLTMSSAAQPRAAQLQAAGALAAAGTGTAVNTCSNPVLDVDLTGWGRHQGGTAALARVTVSNHVVAARGAWLDQNSANPGMFLPQKRVSAGQNWTFAVDSWVDRGGSSPTVQINVDWYSSSGTYLGHVTGTPVPVPSGSTETWTRSASQFIAPTDAYRAQPTAILTAPAGVSWIATACDYRPTSTLTPPTDPTDPPTTTPPPSGDGTQAAVLKNWGTPLASSDEFNYGSPAALAPADSTKWKGPDGTNGCYRGHSDNGRRCQKNTRVDGSKLIMTGESNGDTGLLISRLDRRYGRYEVRARSENTGSSGGLYHPLFLIWASEEVWPADGEYDFVEYTNPDAQCLSAYLHYPYPDADDPVQQEGREKCPVDMTQWHNYGFEWTSSALVGYVDGVEWFRVSGGAGPYGRSNIQDMSSGNLRMQLDNFTGDSGLRAAKFYADWIRIYS